MEAVAPGARGAATRGWRARLDNPRFLGVALIVPAGLFVLALVGGPLLFSVWLSLTDASAGSQGAHFVGLANYRAAMADPVFRASLGNTFLITIVSQVLVLVLAKLLAPLTTRVLAVAPMVGDERGLLGLASRLPAPEWLPDEPLHRLSVSALRTAATADRGRIAVTPGWHRLRTPADLARLDVRLEGWEATRALLT